MAPMPMPVLGSDEQAVFERFVKAVSYLTGCSSALLMVRNGAHWSVASAQAQVTGLSDDHAVDVWLQMILSYGDVVDVAEVMPPNLPVPTGLLQVANEFLICTAVRSPLGELIGVVLVMIPLPHKRLSAAQVYGLQTHAAGLHTIIQPGPDTASGGLAAIERLRLLESVVVHAKDAILITEAEPIDLPGPRIVYCNPAFLATTGFALDEVMGQTPRILQCEETSRETLRQLKEALQQWKPVEVELINARRDGTRFWVQLSIVPVANEKGWFTHWVSVQRDITERKKAEQVLLQLQVDREERLKLESRLVERERIQDELSYAASHDELTKLKNRACFMERLKQVFSQSSPDSIGAATVLYLDLDRFKYVNDGMGHHAGDKLLKRVANRLSRCVDPDALVARIGGDEFAILVSGESHHERAVLTADRVTQALSSTIEIDGQLLFTSCSIGIVTLDAQHNTAEDLVRDADVAMYAAKKKGRGRWAIFDLSMRQASIDMLVMQNALKHAISRDELYLVYQPIFSVMTEEVVGFEALVRWSHPTLGNIAPDVFISLAEDIGVIYELGRWVMRTACKEVKSWSDQMPNRPIKLNVNVSGVELNRLDFAAQVAGILAETGFDPRVLQIEITESVFLHEPEVIALTLEKLRAQQIRIALDDFGTGYSSLSYIDRYPIDVIKIDRSFISRMMHHERTVAIVKSIFSLGQALDLAIVAEGVETQSQLHRLKSLGCPYVQGFLYSPPLLKHDAQALLAKQ
ncbi:EAL domain-containing protein [Pseudomonas sp. HR96]|uniref:putative bifunctional diguanylate cyclase/phosphodiesterase n=1 Tax=Pseudomonas sp. HR96 TaxID=1027966 RepID=UPI002A75E375|nr:EAL domain-containing protein [Pseudomonas sp. HR96]WPP01644.1 EAL domain-containing protein [Pseudomonas sp. HR96]